MIDAVLREIVSAVRRCGETPLRFGIDGAAVVDAAIRGLAAGPLAPRLSLLGECPSLPAVLHERMSELLSDDDGKQAAHDVVELDGRRDAPLNNLIPAWHALAAWLESFHAAARAIDAKAMIVVGMRLEGHSDREIARSTGLGLRLTKRTIADLRAVCMREGLP